MNLKVIPPLQLIISALLMLMVDYYFPTLYFTLPKSSISVFIILLVATIIGILALYDFYKHNTTYHPHTPEKTTTIVDTGIYAYSRNPMYLALVLVLIALSLYLKNFGCFTIIPVFIWYITQYQIKPEEQMLDKLFSKDYKAYCQKVRRWL